MSRALLSLGVALPACLYGHQTAPALHYETVSIHEGQSNPDGSWTVKGGTEGPHVARLEITNWTLQNLISEAFQIRYDHIEGIPDSLRLPMYVIRAESGDETDDALRRMTDAEGRNAKLQMMQEILTERFRLQYHFDTREAPSFLLVAGKQLKLKASAARPLTVGSERRFNPDDPAQPTISEHCSSRGCTLTARGQTMERLTEMIGGQLAGPVIDRTNLAGLWDFKLQWSLSNPAVAEQQDYPPIEAALSEQLGLKIERGKASQRFIIIDHIEPPTPN